MPAWLDSRRVNRSKLWIVANLRITDQKQVFTYRFLINWQIEQKEGYRSTRYRGTTQRGGCKYVRMWVSQPVGLMFGLSHTAGDDTSTVSDHFGDGRSGTGVEVRDLLAGCAVRARAHPHRSTRDGPSADWKKIAIPFRKLWRSARRIRNASVYMSEQSWETSES